MIQNEPDYAGWPEGVPVPPFDSIVAEVRAMIGCGDVHLGRHIDDFGRRVTLRSADAGIARTMVCLAARRLRGMSYPEVAAALDMGSHTSLVSGCTSLARFASSRGAMVMFNELVRRLLIREGVSS